MELPYITGLRSLKDVYDAFIVDLWGVIFEEERLCFGVFNALSQLKESGKEVVFLSNSPRRVADMVQHLEKMGIKRPMYQGLLTAGEIIYYDLKTRQNPFFAKIGRKCFHLGPDQYWQAFSNLGYSTVPNIDEADFILVTGTFGSQDTLEKYDPFFKLCLARRLPMVCACPDSFILKNGQVHLGAGALTAQYQKKGGVIFWQGKPDKAVFDYCCEGLKTQNKSRIAVIGDGLNTDIVGANEAQIDALFVAGGIHSKELNIKRGQHPDMAQVQTLLRQNGCVAKGVLPAFIW